MKKYGFQRAWCLMVMALVGLAFFGCAGVVKPGEVFVGVWTPKDPQLSMWQLAIARHTEGTRGVDGASRFVVQVSQQTPSQATTEMDKGEAVLEGDVLKVFFDGELKGEITVDAAGNFAVYRQMWSDGRLELVRASAP